MAGFSCGARECPARPATDAALTRHQSSCPLYLAHLTAIGTRAPQAAPVAPQLRSVAAKNRLPPGLSKKGPTLRVRKERHSKDIPAAAGSSLTEENDITMEDSFAGDAIGVPDLLATQPLAQPVHPLASPPPPSPPPPPQEEIPTGPGRRKIRLPARYRDILPDVLEPAPLAGEGELPDDPVPARSVRLIVRDKFTTAINTFRLWRDYLHRPTYDPDSLISTSDLSNQFPLPPPQPLPQPPLDSPIPDTSINTSTALLMAWHNNGETKKSNGQLNALVNDVLLHPDFNPEALRGFTAARAEKQAEKEAAKAFPFLQNFQQTSRQFRPAHSQFQVCIIAASYL
ncbi:hypothetical protein B0H14DRAFT_2626367 [Mycena olivaceomarginata]|nr:hypothetical protein B0H14DRAFT_2626367 [Mycena olivaceomarginata]